ncbi:MAG: hypothetical protein QGG39_15700 [Candidatus Poribacteria bacterium]|nr:hypothetical protein [Candidatus Poribacteria bacterium]
MKIVNRIALHFRIAQRIVPTGLRIANNAVVTKLDGNMPNVGRCNKTHGQSRAELALPVTGFE